MPVSPYYTTNKNLSFERRILPFISVGDETWLSFKFGLCSCSCCCCCFCCDAANTVVVVVGGVGVVAVAP